MTELTQEYVRELFDYHNSNLYWKVKLARRIQIGKKAGYLQKDGYYVIRINYKLYKTHRLIFLYHHGYLPKYIDHIDGNPSNNNIKNLRPITKSRNMMNCKQRKNSSSKYKGVCWYKKSNKWQAHITINKKLIHLGLFINEIDAAIAYNIKAIELFGKYANLNEV